MNKILLDLCSTNHSPISVAFHNDKTNDFKTNEYECNSQTIDSITYTSEKTSYEGIRSLSIDLMERTDSKFKANNETHRNSRSMDASLVKNSMSKDKPVKWSEAQRDAILARISFYLMGMTSRSSSEAIFAV